MKELYVKLIQVGMIVGFIAIIIVNALANILPINGTTTGELSDNIPNLFVPVGLTFSIWGIIYIALAFLVFYSTKSLFQKQNAPEYVEKMGIEFIVASVANTVWILFWHYEMVGASLIVMFVLLASLLSAYLRLNIGKEVSRNEKWLVHIPISIYLGWITIATVANVTAVLVTNNWNGFGVSDAIWTIIVLSIATIITITMQITKKDFAYSLVVIWAFIGIIIKRADPAFDPQLGIIVTAGICIGLILLSMFARDILEEIMDILEPHVR